jgi:hypothetical protein
MKKIRMALLIFMICGLSHFAGAETLDNLHFSITVKDLALMSPSELDGLAEKEQWLLLDGSLAALTRLSGKDEEYLLDARLIQGEWIGLEDVRKYDCHLIFRGNEWEPVIPPKMPRKPAEGQILLNNRVLVLARIMGYEMADGRPVSYLLVDQIRKLQ